jgi:hypothetical protein
VTRVYCVPTTLTGPSDLAHHFRAPPRTSPRLRDAGHEVALITQQTPDSLALIGARTLILSLVLTAVALLAGGMAVGKLAGRPLLHSGLRQLVLGALAVAVTFGLGQLIGAPVT